MLDTIGVERVDALFADIPKEFRDPGLNLPPPLSELELKRELQRLAAKNASGDEWGYFLGGGAYRHFIPGVVWNLVKRSEFLTAYTPYQPEISQGVLQASYEFQTLCCQLLNMEVANVGMYDGATAFAEAALMACRLTKRAKVRALATVSPRYIAVLETYAVPQGVEVEVVETATAAGGPEIACLLAQSPNFSGAMEDLDRLGKATHSHGSLLVVATDPIAMGLFKPPGDYGADIAVAEGQPLGVPMSFGGPYVGIFTCKASHVRQMPGRIVGKTVDGQGKTGYVLTLQTREQHIRRERATSNICTSETLIAIANAVYMAALGKWGMRRVAELCYHKAHYAAAQIAKIPGYAIATEGVFFKEFAVTCPAAPSEINKALRARKIVGGLDISSPGTPNRMLVCVTEVNTKAEIDSLIEGLREAADGR